MDLPILRRQFFNRATVREDLSAGLVLGIQSIPDGLASGLLALVNPVYGLYSYMTGVITGALFTSSVFMSVQATSAMALIIASVPQVTQAPDPNVPLFTLAVLTGAIMLVAGLLKLGTLVRFVPNSVMVGFVNAVALLIILGQLDNFTGPGQLVLLYGRRRVGKTALLRHWAGQAGIATTYWVAERELPTYQRRRRRSSSAHARDATT